MKILTLKVGGVDITGPLVIDGKSDPTVADVINQVMKFLYPFAGILLFIYLVWGGYDYLLSGGSPEKVKAGKAKITSAFIGFILLILSYILARLAGKILGITGLF
ncbi:MAG TPA: hypothetical protein VJH96_03055 [Patescibacteria group bacterium]|nr:hypothetical protein [Patescibacteria group bacterium]